MKHIVIAVIVMFGYGCGARGGEAGASSSGDSTSGNAGASVSVSASSSTGGSTSGGGGDELDAGSGPDSDACPPTDHHVPGCEYPDAGDCQPPFPVTNPCKTRDECQPDGPCWKYFCEDGYCILKSF